jgi:hypothetical protein
LRLSYTEEALAVYEGGTPLLSLAFPLTRDRYPNGVTRSFLDGLLPEGEPRRAIAADLDLPGARAAGRSEVRARRRTDPLAIGNCDAHGKNFSLLHIEAGALRLAPLYDLLSTRLYPLDETLAMYVDGIQKSDRVTAERIVNEAVEWGIARGTAEGTVADLLDRLPAAISTAADETPGIPAALPELVSRRVDQLLEK